MKNLNLPEQAEQGHEMIQQNSPDALPTLIEYYRKNSKRIDSLTKTIIINSLFKSALEHSMIFPSNQRKSSNVC